MKVGDFVHFDEAVSMGNSVGIESWFQLSCAPVTASKPRRWAVGSGALSAFDTAVLHLFVGSLGRA